MRLCQRWLERNGAARREGVAPGQTGGIWRDHRTNPEEGLQSLSPGLRASATRGGWPPWKSTLKGVASDLLAGRDYADGTPDPGFRGGADLYGVGAIEIASDQSIFLTGLRPLGWGGYGWGAFRLDPNGQLLADVGGGGYSIALQLDGKVVSGLGSINRVNPDGTADPSFKSSEFQAMFEEIRTIKIQLDGKILFAGRFNTVQEHPCVLIGRLDSDGQLDLGFDSSTGFDWTIGRPGLVYAMALDGQGRIIVGGQLPTFQGRAVPPLVRLQGGPSPQLPLRFVSTPVDQKVPTGATVRFSTLTTG